MKKLYVIILFIFIANTSFAQIKVKEGSFRKIVNYVMDDKEEHVDGNNKPMALIKVTTENINEEERKRLYFKGNRATDFKVVPKIGELYLYLTAEAATVIEIKHPDYGKTMFTLPETLCDFCAYELVVVNYSNQQEEPSTTPLNTYLTIIADHEEAVIYIDDEYAGMKEASKSVNIGSTHSWRIEYDLYHTESGTLTIENREPIVIEKKLRQAYGFLKVTTEPESGAIVFINDKNVGTTPYSSDKMASGSYNVRVAKEMYKTAEQNITITDGETTAIELTMPKNFANTTIKTDEQSDIYLDNEYKGKGNWSGRLNEGPHYVEARKQHHETSSKNFTVTLGSDMVITIDDPKPIYGYLDIETTPLRADVYIDGKNHGKTPRVITNILIGNHKLRLEKEGCAPLTKDITIKEGETLTLKETLQTGKEIKISTGQNGDKIYIDNEYVGESPLATYISYGSHVINAKRGNQSASKNIEVKIGDSTDDYLIVFGKIVNISSSSPGDDVYVDDKKIDKTTPCSLDLSLGEHRIKVKRGKLYETKSISVSKTSQDTYHFTPKKESLDVFLANGVNFITVNGAYSNSPQTSFGITFGQTRKLGWFVSAMSNFNFTGLNVIDKPFNEIAVTGETTSTRLSLTGGLTVRFGGPVYARFGAGYGMRILACKTLSGEYVEYPDNTYKGVDLSAGLMFNMRNIAVSVDAATTNLKTVEVKIGMGINWKRRQ